MAGTDQTKPQAATGGPVVILVEPQLGENIGAAARAMLNCGLTDLRLVRPRDGWPNPRAEAASSGAVAVIAAARVFERTEEAIADLGLVYAMTARQRDMQKPVVAPREAAAKLREATRPAGIIFGPERSGLDNDDIALADAIVTAPLNPGFSSLNLGQAVLIMAWEWFQTTAPALPVAEPLPPATKAELLNLFEHLELALDEAGFFTVYDKRPTMVRNLRNLIERSEPSSQEVRTLHGVVTALSDMRRDGRARRLPRTG